MNSRDRWLAALSLQPVDRLPFWAKLNPSYLRGRAAPFAAMSLPEMHAWVGSEPHGGVPPCLREVRSRTQHRTSQAGERRITEFVTPGGTLRQVLGWDEGSTSWHPVEYPLRTQRDVEILTEWYQDGVVELDATALEKARAAAQQAGRTACLACNIGTSPLMDFLQHLAGVDYGQYLLADCPATVQGLFAAMQKANLRRAEIISDTTPADFLYLTENTSTTLHSPDQFRRHALPEIRACAEACGARGKPLVLHMCGHLRALLADLETLPVAGYEAFTSPPVGNATLADGRAASPGKCLIGGTNAALWLQPAERIIAELRTHLDALPHHRGLIPSSSGVMPPGAAPETIRAVIDWLHQYPLRA